MNTALAARAQSIRRFAILLLLSVAVAGLHAGDAITVNATCPWEDDEGYTPVLVRIDARIDSDLILTARNANAEARVALHVTAGVPLRRTLLMPTTGLSRGYQHTVEWRERSGETGSVEAGHRHQHRDLDVALIDPDESLPLPRLTALLKDAVSKSGEERLVRFAPEQLPDRWQGYPSWLTVVLTPAGERQLSDEQRSALAIWTHAGGAVMLTSPANADAWRKAGVAATVIDPADQAGWAPLAERIRDTQRTENWEPHGKPVPGTEHVPVTAFVLLAVVFSLVVGPLNLWWVRRRNARHLFLITTPLISFATCLVLVVVSLLADGIGVRRTAVQVSCLDHATQRSTTWTGATYFAAFSQSGMSLDADAKLLAMDPDSYARGRHGYYDRDNGRSLAIDWRIGQELSGYLIPARVNRQLAFVEPRPERRRLLVQRDGSGWKLTNGLGVPLEKFLWQDAQRHAWSCARVDSGASLTLAPCAKDNSLLTASDPIVTEVLAAATSLGPDFTQAWHALMNQPYAFAALLAKPLSPLPGPAAIDSEAVRSLAIGSLPPDGATAAEPAAAPAGAF